MKVETKIKLNKFKPYPHQLPILQALDRGYRNVLAIMHRRSGKDITIWNYCIRECVKNPIQVYYCLPTYSQAKKVIWEALDNQGNRFLDYIPSELIASLNAQEQKIRFTNGSLLQLIGSDTYDRSLVGTNPKIIVFSEYALADSRAYSFSRPIVAANQGVMIFISTPRGHNHLWELYNIAKNSPEWFVHKATVEDTGLISEMEIDKIRADGIMSEELIQQEFFCSFDRGIEGAYYTKYLDRMRFNNQIGQVPWESSFLTHTSWDLGMRDSTSIVFFQVIGQTIRVIDYYENANEGLEHYVNVINNKPYTYGKHIGPHDIKVREWGSGISRLEKAKQLGISFITAPHHLIADGIEKVRSTLSKVYIDEQKCGRLIKALENYRKEYDEKRRIYAERPRHDEFSHGCFEGDTLISTSTGRKPIESIVVGDLVKTPTGFKRVTKTYSYLVNEINHIKTSSALLKVTPNHKIFTTKSLVYADTLSYNDVLENEGFIRNKLWKKIFGYCSGQLGINGFRKSYLFLKTKEQQSLMDTFINGMIPTTKEQKQKPIQMGVLCIGMFGLTTTETFLQSIMSIIKMGIHGIMTYQIWSAFHNLFILVFMHDILTRGLNQTRVKKCLYSSKEKQQSGIAAKKEKNGIVEMLIAPYLPLLGLVIKSVVLRARKIMKEGLSVRNSALMHVKLNIELVKRKILLTSLVLFVKSYSFLINTVLKKHVVKSVVKFQLKEQKRVYDFSVEDDNCYYANGYLVSNSDSFRYLCTGLPYVTSLNSAEDLDKRFKQIRYGHQTPSPFRR